MISRTIGGLLFLAFLFVLPVRASATVIAFEFKLSAAGSLEGRAFGLSAITITAVADTANRESIMEGGRAVGYSIDHTTAFINIASIGTLQFLSGTRTFVHNVNYGGIVGFSRGTLGGVDLIVGPANPAFSTWNMLTSIGPITGNAGIGHWTQSQVLTTSGSLQLYAGNPATTFTASIPAPSSLAVMGVSCLAHLRRRRRPTTMRRQ